MSEHEYNKKKWFPKPKCVLDLYIFSKCVFVFENVQKGQRMLRFYTHSILLSRHFICASDLFMFVT